MSGGPKKESPAGAPLWLATFADLMSLLMCFFVLILSFSNMDKVKYQKALGSLDEAFGVQRLKEDNPLVPKGTSLIADHFSPGKPEPTVLDEVRQHTIDDTRQTVEFHEKPAVEVERDAHKIAELMVDEIKEGKVEVEFNPQKIIVRLNDRTSFNSGSDTLKHEIYPILNKVRMFLAEIPGEVIVAGHTDNIPVGTGHFRSNWTLSSLRAEQVATVLMGGGELDKKRFQVAGYADTQPLYPNDTPLNRAMNRRVEIIIEQPKAPEQKLQAVALSQQFKPAAKAVRKPSTHKGHTPIDRLRQLQGR